MADFIEIDTSEVTTFLKVNLGDTLPKAFDTRKVVSDIADFVSGHMKARTLKGLDRDLEPFVGYAPSTAKQRAKRGRQTGHVDLFDKGHMQAAIGTRIDSDTEATVGLFSAIEGKKAIVHQLGLGKMPQREFFGIGKDDAIAQEAIQKIPEDELDRAIKQI